MKEPFPLQHSAYPHEEYIVQLALINLIRSSFETSFLTALLPILIFDHSLLRIADFECLPFLTFLLFYILGKWGIFVHHCLCTSVGKSSHNSEFIIEKRRYIFYYRMKWSSN